MPGCRSLNEDNTIRRKTAVDAEQDHSAALASGGLELREEIGAGVVTETVRETYDRDGVVLLRHAFAPARVRALAGLMSVLVRDAMAGESGLITSVGPGRAEVYNAVRREQLFRDFVFRSAAAEIAAKIAGSHVSRFYFDVTFCKMGTDLTAAGAAATTFHHDVASFAFKGRQLPSLWLALTDVPADGGPLLFALGSHTETETLFRASGDYADPPAEGYRDHTEVFAFIMEKHFEMKTFPAEAGDVIVIHPYVLHGSAPVANFARKRLALCTRWMGDDVTWQPSPYTQAEASRMPRNLPFGSKPPDECFPVTWSDKCRKQPA